MPNHRNMDDHLSLMNWHKLPFDLGRAILRAEGEHLLEYDWLESEIGHENFNFDHKYLYFRHEEDKVKFILKWS